MNLRTLSHLMIATVTVTIRLHKSGKGRTTAHLSCHPNWGREIAALG